MVVDAILELAARRSLAFRIHREALGLADFCEYAAWCRREGFRPEARKRPIQFVRERVYANAVARIDQLDAATRRRARITLDRLRGNAHSHVAKAQSVASALADVTFRVSWPFVATLAECTLVFDDETTSVYDNETLLREELAWAIAGVVSNHRSWIRPISGFRRVEGNVNDQMIALIRYLLVEYNVPRFFDGVWFQDPQSDSDDSFSIARQREAYIKLATGQRVSDCDLPLQLTARQSHEFLQSPEWLTVPQAIRWAKVVSFDLPRDLAAAVVNTQLGRTFEYDTPENDPFFASLFGWLAQNREFPVDRVQALVDWALTERFQVLDGFNEAGEPTTYGPRQPQLTMRGRTVESVLQSIETEPQRSARWFASRPTRPVQTSSKAERQTFTIAKPGSRHVERWVFDPLVTPDQLVDEGDAMGHCVGEYTDSLDEGYEFWSVWLVERGESCLDRITIQVWTRDLTVVEANGFEDRELDSWEWEAVERWIAHRRQSREPRFVDETPDCDHWRGEMMLSTTVVDYQPSLAGRIEPMWATQC